MRMKKNKAFTLTELLLVVAILSIMAAIAMPRYFPQTERARASEAVSMLTVILQGQKAYFMDHNEYLDPADSFNITDEEWAELGLDNLNDDDLHPNRFFNYSFDADNSAAPKEFTAAATRNSIPNNTYQGKTITIDQTGSWGGDHLGVPS